MPLIHGDGLFDGDRINSCSPMAQLYYPRFLCVSNGYGRINLDYMQLISKMFPRWRQEDIPDRETIMVYIQEYVTNRLLYTYRNAGKLWGQWDAKNGTFGKYQTAEDKRSPAPPEEDFTQWLNDNRKFSQKLSEPCGNFAEIISNHAENLRHGVGVGVGVSCLVLGDVKTPQPPLENQSPSASVELDIYSAAKSLGEMIGYRRLHTLKSAIEQAERRWQEKPRDQVILDIVALWREYTGQGLHAPAAIHNWLDGLGSYIDSDHWKKPKAKEFVPQIDWQGGYVGPDGVYVNKRGQRVPGFICPPNPNGKGADA